MTKTAKQHYVPRTYLQAFCVPGSKKVCVFDKRKREMRENNYEDVASQRFFYDIKMQEADRETLVRYLQSWGFKLSDDEEQPIEKMFAKNIETRYGELLSILRKNVQEYSPYFDFNCRMLRPSEKIEFSLMLAYQFIRTSSKREDFLQMSDCLTQVLQDMGASPETIEEYSLDKERAKELHVGMLVDFDKLREMAALFHRLHWTLCVNKTEHTLWTSDSPIVTIPHVHDPILSMSGLACSAIEVALPISPDAVLVMYDDEYHKLTTPDLSYFRIDNPEIVKYYNSAQIRAASRTVISADGDFSLVDEVVKRSPGILNGPNVETRYGGKTYFPRSAPK